MSNLWDPLFGTDRLTELTSDRAWLAALCETEAALARACAEVGLMAGNVVASVERACSEAAAADASELAELGRLAAQDGTPVRALVARLRAALDPDARSAVHLGATSQDIMDTAAMLVTRRALEEIIAVLGAAADEVADLARTHRDTPMAARTLLQQALPTTFGAVAASWGGGLDRAVAGLATVRASGLAVQLGGAAGTLAAWYPHGPRVRAALAADLGLSDPHTSWQAERSRIGVLAGALGVAAGAVGKVGLDIVLMAQTELGEVAESDGGRSSAMPHKQNPVAAVTARAGALQAPALVSTLLAAMAGEHQRAAGAWHAEWQPLTALLRVVGGAATRLEQAVTGLVIHPPAMRANLDATGGLLLAERVTSRLAETMGSGPARQLVEAAAANPDPGASSGDRHGEQVVHSGGFAARLAGDPDVDLDPDELAELLDPLGYLGHAGDLVDGFLKGRQS
jgi:3-carboxy-cis,cis-muconate cycloisomerase